MDVAKILGLPVFVANIDEDDCGMQKISLVDYPAVESDFLAFAGDKKPMMYSVADTDRHLVLGTIMRANFPIYRRDADGYEYYILYKPETIRRMAEKYLAENRQNLFNTMHGVDTDIEGVQMVQWFIKDSKGGVKPKGYDDIEDGSLFGEFHINNPEVWSAIKDGTYKGFSLEGIFNVSPANRDDLDEIEKESMFYKTDKKMTMKEFMSGLRRLVAKFGAVSTDKGILYYDGDGEPEVGMSVETEDADGNRTPAEDGEYKTDEGVTIRVENSQIAEMIQPEAEDEAADAVVEAAEDEPMAEPDVVEEIVDEVGNRLDKIEADIAEIKSAIADLMAVQEEMKKTPAAPSAHEEFVDVKAPQDNDKSMQRILDKVSAYGKRR